jgi:hypothetical protein
MASRGAWWRIPLEDAMNPKDTEQLRLLQQYLADSARAAQQREKHLPTEVKRWLEQGDSALGNEPEKE